MADETTTAEPVSPAEPEPAPVVDPAPPELPAAPEPEPEPAEDPRVAELTAERDDLARRLAEAEAAAERAASALAERSEAAAALERARDEIAAAHAEAIDAWGREKVREAFLEALKGRRFISDAAADFVSLAVPNLRAERRADGTWATKNDAGVDLADAVAIEIDRRPHLFAADHKGGSGTDGSRPPPSTAQASPGSLAAIASRYHSHRTR